MLCDLCAEFDEESRAWSVIGSVARCVVTPTIREWFVRYPRTVVTLMVVDACSLFFFTLLPDKPFANHTWNKFVVAGNIAFLFLFMVVHVDRFNRRATHWRDRAKQSESAHSRARTDLAHAGAVRW